MVAEALWKYIAGPVVADALNNQTAVWNGVTASTGYNPFNTVLWSLLAGLIVYGAYRGFQKYGVRFDRERVLFSVPFLVLGGLLRFIEDTGLAPFYIRILLITPVVYLFIALLYLGTIAVAERYGGSEDRVIFLLGSIFTAPAVLVTGLFIAENIVNYGVLAAVPAALVLTLPVYGLIKDTGLGHPVYYLAAFSQFFGGFVSMLSLPLGYTQKQLLAQAATNIFGAPGILVVKAVLLGIAFYVMKDIEEKEIEALLLLALLVIGIGTGLRVLLRALAGL